MVPNHIKLFPVWNRNVPVCLLFVFNIKGNKDKAQTE